MVFLFHVFMYLAKNQLKKKKEANAFWCRQPTVSAINFNPLLQCFLLPSLPFIYRVWKTPSLLISLNVVQFFLLL